MPPRPQPRFRHLGSKIREWKAGDLLPAGEQSWERFRQVAPLLRIPTQAGH
jgi:hypothetical protein